MHIRVHELARELGISSGGFEKCSARGEFVKSASSTLPPSLVQALREECAPQKPENDCSDYGLGGPKCLSTMMTVALQEAFARASGQVDSPVITVKDQALRDRDCSLPLHDRPDENTARPIHP